MSICTLCKNPIPEAKPETWTSPTGEELQVARSAAPTAIAETSLGEFEICEDCYHCGLPSFFTPLDVAEIHYQFGLEYTHYGQFTRSIQALTQASHTTETADVVAALGYAEDQLGHRDTAVAHYQRALKLDTAHLMSLNTLEKIQDCPYKH